jgi:N-acetyl-anhydromuramyl-L-alanine amidase AmpD
LQTALPLLSQLLAQGGAVGRAGESIEQSDESLDEDRGIERPAHEAAESLEEAPPPPEYQQASRFEPAAAGNFRVWTKPQPRPIRRIVIHITSGHENINGTIGWFQNPRAGVSAHYIVGRNGEVVQMVRHNDVAFHAHLANTDSIGIEHVAREPREFGPKDPGMFPTAVQYCASAALVRWLCDQFGIPIDRTHILGHSEADPNTTHTNCPNAVWEWDYFMDMVRNAYCLPAPAGSRVVESAEVAESEGGSLLEWANGAGTAAWADSAMQPVAGAGRWLS